jgi:hypothetical protein
MGQPTRKYNSTNSPSVNIKKPKGVRNFDKPRMRMKLKGAAL